MFECELPFDHKTLHLELEDKNFAGVMEGHQNEFKTTKSQEELVEESLANPYGSPSLEELCAGKKDIVIISSDHTRPVPSRVTMPILLHHIHSAAPEARVRILVATGMHRPSTHEELVNKYGEEIVANEEIVMHVATDDSMMKKIGTLPSGGECIINKIAADCDLLLAEGFIEPHFFAGFSGSRKSVLPGIASYKTIMYNHNGQFGNGSFRECINDFRAVADDTVIFLRVSRKEARNIFESNQRNVETVAETDETARLVAGINIEHSGKVGRLIGDDTYRTTCQTCKTNEDILGKIRHNFKEIAVVYHSLDDIFHIIRNIRVCRNDSVQNGVFTVGFIRAVLLFSFVHIILRQERKQFADTHQQFFFGVTHKMSHSAFAAVSHGTTQFFLAYFLVDNGLHYVLSLIHI